MASDRLSASNVLLHADCDVVDKLCALLESGRAINQPDPSLTMIIYKDSIGLPNIVVP